MVAMALQEDGWWLRRDIPWIKRSAMPESVSDRPTTAHEYIFMLTKSERYFYDGDAIRLPLAFNRWSMSNPVGSSGKDVKMVDGAPGQAPQSFQREGYSGYYRKDGTPAFNPAGRSRRSTDWFFDSLRAILDGENMMLQDEKGEPLTMVVNPENYSGAHFATFPQQLVRPLILVSSSERGVCPKCGAAWVRVVEKGPLNTSARGMTTLGPKYDSSSDTRWNSSTFIKEAFYEHSTVGWRPSCRCGCDNVVPAVILDPFCGSGTTVKVARDLGRVGIGIDLKHEYLLLAKERVGNRLF
mgnify:FL=1